MTHRSVGSTGEMSLTLELSADDECASRPFSAREWTDREEQVMGHMLERLRTRAGDWPADDSGFLFRGPDADGLRHWIRVPDCAALRGAHRLTVVGFFGQARAAVDQTPIDRLEAGIVETLDTIPGVL